ncbi:MAG: hypothetical protein PHW82_08840 [Bacteroidales bacterium]|nr:hypothetical protein [Bacteroidales bacterium]
MKMHLYLVGFIFCFFALLSCSSSGTPEKGNLPLALEFETDWQEEQFKDKIKSIDEIRYYYNYDETAVIGKGSMESRDVMQFNNNGFIINYANYGSENYLISETKKFYNENGLCDSSLVYNYLGEICESIVFFYDETGLLFKTENHYPDGKLMSIEKTEYNADRKPVKTELFDGIEEEAIVISETQYNDKNQKEQGIFHDISQDVYMLTKYEYDSDGMLSKRSYFDKDGELQDTYEFEYEFDNKGNWITRSEIRNGKMAFIVERELVYFD